jgi:exodeoxyribonuclease V alpha subunit
MTAAPDTVPAETLLATFAEAGVLSDADVRLALRLARIGHDDHPDVVLAIALALRAPRYGHVCVELDRIAEIVAVEPRPDGSVGIGVSAGTSGPARDAPATPRVPAGTSDPASQGPDAADASPRCPGPTRPPGAGSAGQPDGAGARSG